jgi:hypothetical protein
VPHIDAMAVAVDQAGLRMGHVRLVEIQRTRPHRRRAVAVGGGQIGDAIEQGPGAFVMLGRQHPAAAQAIGAIGQPRRVERTAKHMRVLFEDGDLVPVHARVAHQKGSACQRADATADEIRLHCRTSLATGASAPPGKGYPADHRNR